MIEYYAVYDREMHCYDDETRSFECVVTVGHVLCCKDWTIYKKENGKFVQMNKYDFVKELDLIYTEIDVK